MALPRATTTTTTIHQRTHTHTTTTTTTTLPPLLSVLVGLVAPKAET